MDFNKLEFYLTDALKKLPGESAQLKMAPETRLSNNNNKLARDAGVLILLFPYKGEMATVFMKRNVYPGVHSGQISFPGGRVEATDKNIIYTALREAHEEIGINPKMVNIIGQITSLYIPVSNYNVIPVTGILRTTPAFNPDKSEVQELIVVKIKEFYKKENISTFHFSREGISIKAPCYTIKNNIIWGATAMILSEFLEIIRDYPKIK